MQFLHIEKNFVHNKKSHVFLFFYSPHMLIWTTYI